MKMEALDKIFNSNDILDTKEVAELTPESLYDQCVSNQDYFMLLEVKNSSTYMLYYDNQDEARDEALLDRALKLVRFFFEQYSNSFEIIKMKEDEIPVSLATDMPTAFPWLILMKHVGFEEALKNNRILRNSTFGSFTFSNIHKNYVVARISNRIRPARLIKMLCELNDYLSYKHIVSGNSILVINTSELEVKESSMFNDPSLNPKFKNTSITISNPNSISIYKEYSRNSVALYFFSLFNKETIDIEAERSYFEKFSKSSEEELQEVNSEIREIYSEFKGHF